MKNKNQQELSPKERKVLAIGGWICFLMALGLFLWLYTKKLTSMYPIALFNGFIAVSQIIKSGYYPKLKK